MGLDLWESSLAIRDSVFGQIFILAVVAFVVYRLFRRLAKFAIIAALLLFSVLYVASVMNITLWTP